jgi:hypothetical protein
MDAVQQDMDAGAKHHPIATKIICLSMFSEEWMIMFMMNLLVW